MTIGGTLEFFLGNTFSCVVFLSFSAFWYIYATTLTPFYNAQAAYAKDPLQFYSSFAFFLVFMGLMCLIYLICALRTNLVFLVIFFTLVIAFGLLAGAFWQLANGATQMSTNLQTAGGAVLFVTCMAGWWIFLAQMLASVDFPFNIPVGDVSHLIRGASEKQKQNVD